MCPELNSLTMEVRQVINKIWHPQSSSVPFDTLRELQMFYNDEKSVVFPFEFIQRFKNLEQLRFMGSSVEEICKDIDVMHVPDGPFLSVKELQLWGLNNLRHLFENPENVKRGKAFQNAETLEVCSCESLTRLVPFLDAFRNLKDLKVTDCKGMKYLLASSTAESLVLLTRISIENCEQMREIIASKQGETEDEIVFSRLRILALHDLPSLERFYSGNAAIRFPLLEKLILSRCPEMQSFSRGIITTQKLNQIIAEIVNVDIFYTLGAEKHWDRIEYECVPRKQLWEGDINLTIQKILKDNAANERRDWSTELVYITSQNLFCFHGFLLNELVLREWPDPKKILLILCLEEIERILQVYILLKKDEFENLLFQVLFIKEELHQEQAPTLFRIITELRCDTNEVRSSKHMIARELHITRQSDWFISFFDASEVTRGQLRPRQIFTLCNKVDLLSCL
ncbi:hypothetical protein TIFTF001_012951 [Ficus carica]|uniref:Disease resistance protein At4g27190-like leucine-rich repeats domain-containing protein n=1 Tax=Ficus carica TaxID=3494 RepID=A0AA88D6S3_FICCA|nr:hypothetical protein TIFTF001_012951 [Ficus carica]